MRQGNEIAKGTRFHITAIRPERVLPTTVLRLPERDEPDPVVVSVMVDRAEVLRKVRAEMTFLLERWKGEDEELRAEGMRQRVRGDEGARQLAAEKEKRAKVQQALDALVQPMKCK